MTKKILFLDYDSNKTSLTDKLSKFGAVFHYGSKITDLSVMKRLRKI